MKHSKNSDLSGLHPKTIRELSKVNHKIVNKNKKLLLHEDLLKIKQAHNERDKEFRPLLLNIGMVVSLLMAIAAINWKSYNDGTIVDLGEVEADINEVIEIPPSKQLPPPPPKQEVFKITEVKDTEIIEDITIDLDVEVTEDAVIEIVEISTEIEEEVVEEVFVIVEQAPVPVGGLEAFYTYLSEELVYPAQALRVGISGTVFVQFIIEKDGSITEAKVVKGIGAGCDEEALRVIEEAPVWIPGKQRGVAVRVKKVIPVRFVMAKR